MRRFLIKCIANGVVTAALLMWLTEAGFVPALLTALALAVLAWLIGDQLILRLTNNTVATLADGVLAFAFLWFVADVMDWSLTAGELLFITAVLAIVEWTYHRYLGERDRADAQENWK